MLKNLKKYLDDKDIFDIVVYGSFVKGKANPNDIDIMIIFLGGSLKERLDKIQDIKLKLKDKFKIDIKQMLLVDFFKTDFLAKSGIMLEGFSMLKNKKFCNTIGFKSYVLFWYNLKNLNHSQKVKFNYILAGRNKKGIIEELKGIRLVNGAVKIPIESSLIFEDILKRNNIFYSKKSFLEEI